MQTNEQILTTVLENTIFKLEVCLASYKIKAPSSAATVRHFQGYHMAPPGLPVQQLNNYWGLVFKEEKKIIV